ncbi:helix-turn-helix transcriptional regulator [Desulfosporosinus youngiae]|uniref:Putative transcriptional regulator n=1 Tax=Desulfosporosinus youngiae DSM 17734 TaxID=768710 RepID=H5Y0D1_9FIRM|nr:helix-turn-helix transcriptional regulator [Desulfosporosinus youngiae]EHQ92187.1 putative transcriptional regulator [Desulfosporosinus youngiae DSM 17734]
MANHITQLRTKAGIKTAKEASEKLKISAGMMYQMEEGVKKPSPTLAIKMAKLFNCTLENIFLPYNITNSDKERSEPLGARANK